MDQDIQDAYKAWLLAEPLKTCRAATPCVSVTETQWTDFITGLSVRSRNGILRLSEKLGRPVTLRDLTRGVRNARRDYISLGDMHHCGLTLLTEVDDKLFTMFEARLHSSHWQGIPVQQWPLHVWQQPALSC